MDRRYRRDGETSYPEWSGSDLKFELEVSEISRDLDRLDTALLNGIRYVRPVDIARHHGWNEYDMLVSAYGGRKESDKYGNRIK